MKQVTTFVGIDAHKQDLFVAMPFHRRATPIFFDLAENVDCQAQRRLP